MKMMRAKERYKVNNVITIIRVNFMQRRTHFTFLNSFFPPSIYNRIQKMKTTMCFFLSKWNEKERSNCSSVSLFIHLLIHSSLNIIHPSTPTTFYLYLHSSPEQKNIYIYVYWRKYERASWKNEKKSLRKLFFLCSELWLSRFTLITNADDGDETLTTTETMILMMIRQWQFLFSTLFFLTSYSCSISSCYCILKF